MSVFSKIKNVLFTEEDETDCWYGVTSLDKFEYEYPAKANTRYYYCFAKFRKGSDAQTNKYTRYFSTYISAYRKTKRI